MDTENKKERIQKVLARAGIASRRKTEEYIQQGFITVNGNIVTKPGETVDLQTDIVTFKGKRIFFQQKQVYYLLNKPKLVICTCHDEKNRKTVLDFFHSVPYRLFPVGRLDYQSDGAIILTNDGDFAFRLIHPKHEIPKHYLVQIREKISQAEIEALRQGMVIDHYKTKPCQVVLIRSEKPGNWLEFTLYEGRNRQIRKMMELLEKHVVSLTRTSIGPCTLKGLLPGEFRSLSKEELNFFLRPNDKQPTKERA